MRTNQSLVSSADPADLIASIWFRFGYRVRDSVVTVGLEGPRRRLGAVVRADLPAPAQRSATLLRTLADRLVAPLERSPASALVAVIADDHALEGPVPALVAHLQRRARRAGLGVHDVLAVTASRYASLLCHDRSCCPRGGHPLERVLSSRSAVAHVLSGAALLDRPEDLVADVRPEPSGGERTPERAAGERSTVWVAFRDAVRTAAQPGGPSAAVAGLDAALDDARLRDAVIVHLLGGDERRVAELLGDERAPGSAGPDAVPGAVGPAGAALDAIFDAPLEQPLLAPGRSVLAATARAAPPGRRAPCLAVLAVLAWFEGRTVRARLLVEQARLDRPDVVLGELVDALLTHGVVPGWSRRDRLPGELHQISSECETRWSP